MALTYGTGTASGHFAFLDALDTFIDSLPGWTVAESVAAGALPSPYGSDRQLSIRCGTAFYAHFASDVNNAQGNDRLHFAISTGITTGGGILWYGHAGGGGSSHHQAISIPRSGESFTYHLIADDTFLWIVAAMTGGWFQIGFVGQLDLFHGGSEGYYSEGMVSKGSTTSAQEFDSTEAATGGIFYFTSPAAPHGSILNGPSGMLLGPGSSWVGVNSSTASSTVGQTTFGRGSSTALSTFQRYNVPAPMFDGYAATLVAPFFPVTVFAPHPTLTGNHAPIGRVPGAYYVNTRNLGETYAGGATKLDVGGRKFFVFPAGRTRRVAHAFRYSGLAIEVPA